MIEIKFIPTGHIFSLPDSEAIRIVTEDRGNYKVVSGKIPEEKKPKEQKSVQELVVIEKPKDNPNNKNDNKPPTTKPKNNKNNKNNKQESTTE